LPAEVAHFTKLDPRMLIGDREANMGHVKMAREQEFLSFKNLNIKFATHHPER
jgi:hypothetical protein